MRKSKRTEQDAHSMPRWDTLSRQRQSELCRHSKPWKCATGPATPYGKQVSSQNSRKHRRRQVTGVGNVANIAFVSPKTNGCDVAQEPESCISALETVPECQSDVTPEKRGDTLQVASRAKYTGLDSAIASICREKTLEIFAMQEGWAVCWVPDFPGLVTVPIGELEQV